jgi:hypothetical protein
MPFSSLTGLWRRSQRVSPIACTQMGNGTLIRPPALTARITRAEETMTQRNGTAITVTAGFAITALSAAVAFANIPAEIVDDGPTVEVAPFVEDIVFPAPVAGLELYFADASGAIAGCVSDTEVIRHLEDDRLQFGGETVMLADGLDQAFADAWRQQIDMEQVAVSDVLAHVFGEGDDVAVDVVELDANGCALSRTLLSEDDWNYLLRRAAGVEV